MLQYLILFCYRTNYKYFIGLLDEFLAVYLLQSTSKLQFYLS